MSTTLFVEKLLESRELTQLYECLPGEEQGSIKKRLADCDRIIDYLRERFISANGPRPELRPSGKPAIDVERTRAELGSMESSALLRYGHVLRWLCTAEAGLAPDHTLEVNEALL